MIEQKYLSLLKSACPAPDQLFLVGGAVRDWKLGIDCKDYDLVVAGDAFSVARQFARSSGSGFFIMDEEHKVARTLLKQEKSSVIFDFSEIRGGDLLDDLKARDFTINAMAVPLDSPERIIDPLNGQNDLDRKILRACSPLSLINDPVRLIRAVRFSRQFDLSFEKLLLDGLSLNAHLVSSVSSERIRDELFHVLDLEECWLAIEVLDQFGLLIHVLPELKQLQGVQQSSPHTMDVWNHTIYATRWVDRIVKGIISSEQAVDPIIGKIIQSLAPFLELLRVNFMQPIQQGRNRTGLLKLATLLHDVAKPETRTCGEDGRYHFHGHHLTGLDIIKKIGTNLSLSNREIEYLSVLVGNHMSIHWLCKQGGKLTRKQIYHYFKCVREYGIDLSLLSLSDLLAKSDTAIPEGRLSCELTAINDLFSAWFQRKEELISPRLLLDGHEIMKLLRISGGPDLGLIIEALEEAQALGEVTDKTAAEIFVSSYRDRRITEKE